MSAEPRSAPHTAGDGRQCPPPSTTPPPPPPEVTNARTATDYESEEGEERTQSTCEADASQIPGPRTDHLELLTHLDSRLGGLVLHLQLPVLDLQFCEGLLLVLGRLHHLHELLKLLLLVGCAGDVIGYVGL